MSQVMVRLQKYLADCGLASRRQSEALIAEGRVRVNGDVAVLGQSVDPGADEVTLDGQPVRLDQKLYLVLFKPRGVVTTATDPQGRKTVLDCLPELQSRVYPVGRLDMDVEGVLLLTNDGELAYRLTHPKFAVDKVYTARVKGRFTTETARTLEKGLTLDDGLASVVKAEVLRRFSTATEIRLVLREGRKREVKRLCAATGHPVLSLRRTSMGNITTRGLRPGEWRYLKEAELVQLRKLAGLEP